MSNNKLRKIFCPDEEDIAEQQQLINRIKQELIENKSCCTCQHARDVEHWEMGKFSGYDPYCNILNGLRFGCDGQQCLWYKTKEEQCQ